MDAFWISLTLVLLVLSLFVLAACDGLEKRP